MSTEGQWCTYKAPKSATNLLCAETCPEAGVVKVGGVRLPGPPMAPAVSTGVCTQVLQRCLYLRADNPLSQLFFSACLFMALGAAASDSRPQELSG